jgi:hypothetical protein
VSDIRGFVSLDKTRRLIVVAFRGSETMNDFLVSDLLSISLVPIDLCANCASGSGFVLGWARIRNPIIQQVRTLLDKNPGFIIVVTGKRHMFRTILFFLSETYFQS